MGARNSLPAVVMALAFPILAQAQNCSELLQQGIYDIRSSGTELRTASSYASWFCDQKFSSAQQADNFGGSLAFPFHGLPVQLGFNSQSNSWESWYTTFCGSISTNQSLQSRVRDYVQTINQGIIGAFERCVSAPGLHVWLERTDSPKVFKFAARFVSPNAENPTARISDFVHGSSFSCTPEPTGRSVDYAEFRSRCVRTNDGPVDITINATWPPQGGAGLSLPAIPQRPVLESIIQAMERGRSFSVLLNHLDRNIGPIPARATYTVAYLSSIDTWRATGPHTDGIHTDFPTVDYGYGPGSARNLDGSYPPSAHKIVIFGHDFDFNEDGTVYDRGNYVGELVIERRPL